MRKLFHLIKQMGLISGAEKFSTSNRKTNFSCSSEYFLHEVIFIFNEERELP